MKLTEDHRIYVIVPHEVIVHGRRVQMECGRIAAQVGHVVSKLRHRCPRTKAFQEITTVVLGSRDTSEMQHVLNLLKEKGIKLEVFQDTNAPFYGTSEPVLTGIATFPLTKQDVVGVLDYLPLWKCHG